MKMSRKWMIGVVVVAVAMAGAGCGKKVSEDLAEETVEEGLGADEVVELQLDSDAAPVESEEGRIDVQVGAGAQIPANFPKDVYVPAQANVLSAITMPDGVNLSLQSAESLSAVLEQYVEEMRKQGWAADVTMETVESAMYSYAKGERRAHVVLRTDEGGTTIQIAIGKED